jgi:methionine-rich copper-binding protein CopC
VRGARRERAFAALLAAVIVPAALAWCATDARAHARLERSIPATGAVLTTAPTTVELWFNELLDDEFNEVLVFRARPDGAPADATNLATAKPTVDDADRTHLSAPVAALASGAYVIQWKVLSRDGHSARGRVLFRVGAGE